MASAGRPLIDEADMRQLATFVGGRISAAAVHVEPFPHLVVNNLLPEDLYRRVLEAWPPDALFGAKNYERRLQVNLSTNLAQFPPEIQGFWVRMLELSDAVNRALHRKFGSYFDRKFAPLFGPRWREIVASYRISYRELQLAQYSGQAGLHPHVDSVRLIVNSFLYASERAGSEPELATVLYRSFGFATVENNFKLRPDIEARVLKPAVVVPYAANRLIAFVNTPNAFHGVREFDIGERRRRILLFSPLVKKSRNQIEADFPDSPPEILEGEP